MIEAQEQESLFNLICRPGGVDIREAMEKTGLSYREVELEARDLISRGIQVSATSVAGSIYRLFLSPYDQNYKKLMKN